MLMEYLCYGCTPRLYADERIRHIPLYELLCHAAKREVNPCTLSDDALHPAKVACGS